MEESHSYRRERGRPRAKGCCCPQSWLIFANATLISRQFGLWARHTREPGTISSVSTRHLSAHTSETRPATCRSPPRHTRSRASLIWKCCLHDGGILVKRNEAGPARAAPPPQDVGIRCGALRSSALALPVLRLESLMPTALEQEQTLAATWEQIAVRQQKMTCHTHASPRHHRKGRKTSTSASAAYRCARLVHWGGGRGGGKAGCTQ